MTPEEFWTQHHERIEHAVFVKRIGDPDTPNDDRTIIQSWGMKEVALECVRIFQENGVICDRLKLLRLLEYLTDAHTPIGYLPYREASELLHEITGGH